MNVRNEKLMKLISGMTAGLGCMALAGVLFWTAPMEVKAVPLSSNPNGTTAAGSENNENSGAENTDGENADNQANASESGGTVTSVTVIAGNVNVRSDASTSAGLAGKASNGTEMTVTGEKADSSGTTWYAVTYESNGSTVNGYIRSDLVEAHVTEPVVTEPETPEEEQPAVTPEEPAVTNDYFVQYEDDGTGSGVNAWYLYDNTMGNKYKIDSLLNAEATNQSNAELMEAQTGKLKMIIVVLAGVILVLIIVLTVLILKLRNSSYDDDDYDDDEEDEEEDEDEDEEEEAPRKRRFGFGSRRNREEDDEDEEEDEDDEEEEEYRPRRKAPVTRTVKEKPSRRARYEEDEDDEEEEEDYRPRRSAKNTKTSDKNWQSKNFLDDDDLEFEFLDLK